MYGIIREVMEMSPKQLREVHCSGCDCLMSEYAYGEYSRGNIVLPDKYKDIRVSFTEQNNFIEIDSSAILSNVGIHVNGTGNYLIIEEGCELEYCYLMFKGDNNLIKIGKHTQFISGFWGDCVVHCKGVGRRIVIGEDCIVSGGVIIRNSDGHDISVGGKIVNEETDITIGRHVWLGTGVSLLKGASIGNNCIVGMRSVVTKSFGDNSVIGGSPAKKVKELKGTWIK